MEADVTAIVVVRRSEVEPSAAGLSSETDGREDDGEDGRVGGKWRNSSISDCWKNSSENTCCKFVSKLTGDVPLAVVDMPTSISPLSHPMKAAICKSPLVSQTPSKLQLLQMTTDDHTLM